MFDLIRASFISIVIVTYPSRPLGQSIINCAILFAYIGLFIFFRPNKNRLKFFIGLFIELCVLTAYLASCLLVVYKSDHKNKKILAKVIIYSSKF